MSRFWLFVTSLAPALLIGSIRSIPSWGCWGWLGVALSVALFFSAYPLLRARREIEPALIVPKSVKDETAQIPIYLITFIFPFLFIGENPNSATVSAYAIFALMLLVMLFRTNLALVNPALLVRGYHVYSVVTEKDAELLVIAKENLRPGSTYRAHLMSLDLYLLAVPKDDKCQTQ